MDDYDFESGLSTSKTPYGSDLSGVYVAEPNATSTNVAPASGGSWWDSITKGITALGGAAGAASNVYKNVEATSASLRGTTPSNIAKQTGSLTQQQLAAQRSAEQSNASTMAAIGKYLWVIIPVALLGVVAFLISGKRKSK